MTDDNNEATGSLGAEACCKCLGWWGAEGKVKGETHRLSACEHCPSLSLSTHFCLGTASQRHDVGWLQAVWIQQCLDEHHQAYSSLYSSKDTEIVSKHVPWVRHTDVSHVCRPRSLLKDLIPFPKVGIRPETKTCCDWILILILLGCVGTITGSRSVSSVTDVSARVRFSIFSILTCMVLESQIRISSCLSGSGVGNIYFGAISSVLISLHLMSSLVWKSVSIHLEVAFRHIISLMLSSAQLAAAVVGLRNLPMPQK